MRMIKKPSTPAAAKPIKGILGPLGPQLSPTATAAASAAAAAVQAVEEPTREAPATTAVPTPPIGPGKLNLTLASGQAANAPPPGGKGGDNSFMEGCQADGLEVVRQMIIRPQSLIFSWRSRPGPPGAVTRPPRFPSSNDFVWRFCVGAQRA